MPKCIAVMGANSAIAVALIQQAQMKGWEVVAMGRNEDALNKLYGNAKHVQICVLNPCNSTEVEAAFTDLTQQGRQVTGYAHCVGSILVTPLIRTTDQQIEQVIGVNLISAMYGLRAWLKHAKQHGQGGSAVLVSTCATGIGVANHEAIAAAKGGVESMARAAAATYAADGIRVNVVAPGLTDSPMAAGFLKSDVMRAASEKQYPLNGINQPEEVAETLQWLLSDHSARVTGAVLNVDGGFRNIRPLVK
ncbi:MAG TPA: SDR family oxidoreductase [Limnobacter sp.]|nr:SDR family oxidoreductase [Limnobacter sp.]